ncbi:MAG: ribonuclease E/G [Eubacterium sp.]|nr:ribonuclease E/G [Eubacterium sp.]
MRMDYIYTVYQKRKMGFLFEDRALTEAHFFFMRDDNMADGTSGMRMDPQRDKIPLQPDQVSRVGEICTAVVERVIPAIDGVFLTGPEGRKLFMHLADEQRKAIILRKRGNGNGIKPGDTLLVQITADAQKQKLYEASSNLALSGESVIVNRTGQIGISKKLKDEEKREILKKKLQDLLREEDPEGEFGVILRTSAGSMNPEAVCKETVILLCKLKGIIKLAETTPEYKVLYQNEEKPEDQIRRLIFSGRYESVAIHTDLPLDEALIQSDAATEVTFHHITEKESSPLVLFNIPVLLEKALKRKVFLSDGGYLYVEKTEAMTVIDVNSGKAIHGKEHEKEALAANKLAAKEIARLLRLRNLSGIIIVDFISMKKAESNRELLHYLRQVTAYDTSPVNIVDMTKLGLVEITRKKKDAPLDERLADAETGRNGQGIHADVES